MYYSKVARSILEEKTYYSEYQPVMETATGEIYAYEALARFWYEDEELPPEELFRGLHPDPEMLGALESSVKNFQLKRAPSGYPLFINVDPSAFVFDLEHFDRAISSFQGPEGLVFELVEDPLRISSEDRERLMQYLEERGIRLALDNFGRQDRSFSFYLIESADYIKMDRQWIARCRKEVNYSAFAKSVAEFAHSLGKKVIFGGVETPEDLQTVKSHGADFAQGYLYREKFVVVDSW